MKEKEEEIGTCEGLTPFQKSIRTSARLNLANVLISSSSAILALSTGRYGTAAIWIGVSLVWFVSWRKNRQTLLNRTPHYNSTSEAWNVWRSWGFGRNQSRIRARVHLWELRPRTCRWCKKKLLRWCERPADIPITNACPDGHYAEVPIVPGDISGRQGLVIEDEGRSIEWLDDYLPGNL